MEGLRIRLSIRLIGRLSSSPSKMASTKHATVPIANWRIPSRDADSPTLKQPMLLEGSVEEDGVNGGGRRMHWRWWSRDHNYLRRMVLVGMAWPFLTTSLGRQASANVVDVEENPLEMAIVAALDARDMLPALSTFLLQAKSKLGPTGECRIRLKSHTRKGVESTHCLIIRTLNMIHQRLEISLPRLVEELEIDKRYADQLLEGLKYVEEDLCSHNIVSSTLSENSSISRANIEGSLKLLKLARSKVDVFLQKVPQQLLELANLVRGIRPMA